MVSFLEDGEWTSLQSRITDTTGLLDMSIESSAWQAYHWPVYIPRKVCAL
jgi:hypothetical protein